MAHSEPIDIPASELSETTIITYGSEPESEDGPSDVERSVPPMIMLFCFIVAMLIIYGLNKRRSVKARQHNLSKIYSSLDYVRYIKTNDSIHIGRCHRQDSTETFLSAEEKEILNYRGHFHRPKELIIIITPTVVTLILCPVVLFLYGPMASSFWADFASAPQINEAIACFLAPAGFVYAVSFGFTFQNVSEKQQALTALVSTQVSTLSQIIVMVTQIKVLTPDQRRKIYLSVKNETLDIIQDLRTVQSSDISSHFQQLLEAITGNIQVERGVCVGDKFMMKRLLESVFDLSTSRSKIKQLVMTRIHPVQWLFLEMLGFTPFFGILFVRALSYRMELTMCLLTVLSIGILCYIVADLDSPFNGLFTVSLDAYRGIVNFAEQMYHSQQTRTCNDIEANQGSTDA